MDKLSDRELTLIRRAAEDAINACNKNHKPFIDVVAHPLNICTLVDMSKLSLMQQKRIDELRAEIRKLIEEYKSEEKELELKEWEQSTIYGRIAIELEEALKGGEV